MSVDNVRLDYWTQLDGEWNGRRVFGDTSVT